MRVKVSSEMPQGFRGALMRGHLKQDPGGAERRGEVKCWELEGLGVNPGISSHDADPALPL